MATGLASCVFFKHERFNLSGQIPICFELLVGHKTLNCHQVVASHLTCRSALVRYPNNIQDSLARDPGFDTFLHVVFLSNSLKAPFNPAL